MDLKYTVSAGSFDSLSGVELLVESLTYCVSLTFLCQYKLQWHELHSSAPADLKDPVRREQGPASILEQLRDQT